MELIFPIEAWPQGMSVFNPRVREVINAIAGKAAWVQSNEESLEELLARPERPDDQGGESATLTVLVGVTETEGWPKYYQWAEAQVSGDTYIAKPNGQTGSDLINRVETVLNFGAAPPDGVGPLDIPLSVPGEYIIPEIFALPINLPVPVTFDLGSGGDSHPRCSVINRFRIECP